MSANGQGDDLGRVGELLADVLAGTRTREDPELLAACADPSVARRLDELIALQSRLDRAATAEQAALAEPPASADAALQRLLRRRLAELGPRSSRWRLFVLLAAALLIGGGALLRWWPRAEPTDVTLNSEHRLTVDPEYAAVRWQGAPGRFWFQVRLRSRSGTELERSELLRTDSWAPTRRDLPDEVVIELWLVDSAADGRCLATQAFGRDGRPH